MVSSGIDALVVQPVDDQLDRPGQVHPRTGPGVHLEEAVVADLQVLMLHPARMPDEPIRCLYASRLDSNMPLTCNDANRQKCR